jgi:hypothetical protein
MHTAIDGESEEFCFLKMHGVWKFNNKSPSHPSHPVDTFCARPSMAVGWCLHRRLRRKTIKQNSWDSPSGPANLFFAGERFPHPMHFCLRRAKERTIRTRPSTASPRNLVFWFAFLAVDAGTSLRSWTEPHRCYQRGGTGGEGLYCSAGRGPRYQRRAIGDTFWTRPFRRWPLADVCAAC